jgi:AcrR family transcriptional regulator
MSPDSPAPGLAELVRGDDAGALPRGRHSLPRERVRATQRGRLLLGMAEAVAAKGYAQTTVADVLRQARVSRETFYEHFANTEECFLAAYDECVGGLSTLLTGAGAAAGEGGRLERLLDAYLGALAAEPALARTFLVEVHAAGPRALQRRVAVHERFVALVGEILRSERTLDVPDPDFAVRAFVGAMTALATMAVIEGRPEDLPGLAAPMLALVERLSA